MLILTTELFLSLFIVPSIHASFLIAKDGTINQTQIIQTFYCSITSCYLTCNRNPYCDMIAVPSGAILGKQKECFHVKNLPMDQEVIEPIYVTLISQENIAEESIETTKPTTSTQITQTTPQPPEQTVDKFVKMETNGKFCSPEKITATVNNRAHCKQRCIQERARYCMSLDDDNTYCIMTDKCDNLRVAVSETYTVWERVDIAFLDSQISINGNQFWGIISTLNLTFEMRFDLYLQSFPTDWNTLMEISQFNETTEVQELFLRLQIKGGTTQGTAQIELDFYGFDTFQSSSFSSNNNWLPVEIKQYQDSNKYYLSMSVNNQAPLTAKNEKPKAINNVVIYIGETTPQNFGYIKQLELFGVVPRSS